MLMGSGTSVRGFHCFKAAGAGGRGKLFSPSPFSWLLQQQHPSRFGGCTQAVTSPLEGDISREGIKQGITQSTQSTEACSKPHIPSAPPEHLWGTEHSVAPGGERGHRPAAQHRLNKATFVTHAASRVRSPATNAFPREHCPGGEQQGRGEQYEWLPTIGCLWFPVGQPNPMLAMGHVTAHLGSVLEPA